MINSNWDLFRSSSQRDPDGAEGRSLRVGVEAAGDAGRPDARAAHADGADVHQDVAQDPAAGELFW